MFVSHCCFLTCRQVSQEAGQVVWYSHLFQNFPQFIVIHTVKGFGLVNKGEIDVFLELSCFFHDPAGVGHLISGSSAFSKTSLNIWNFTVHVLLKPGLKNFEHYFTSMWDDLQLICFKSWKMMLWKCYTQYAIKFGKLNNGHRTGKGQFSFQSQRKTMPKNAQTTAQLNSSHTLGK